MGRNNTPHCPQFGDGALIFDSKLFLCRFPLPIGSLDWPPPVHSDASNGSQWDIIIAAVPPFILFCRQTLIVFEFLRNWPFH